MKYLMLMIATVLSFNTFADASNEVFIRGKIGGDFDDKRVKVIDTEGQSYYLPKSLFPAKFKFAQGEKFAIEVDEKELDKIKIQNK